ncbi:helix-turn-helix domain-containing protein [Acidiphilium sp.]|uniref:helix-turn-helix domain-containing protein n=1 Tax=Acidiphilium sp. TaxID=527 RepID=UPI003D027052
MPEQTKVKDLATEASDRDADQPPSVAPSVSALRSPVPHSPLLTTEDVCALFRRTPRSIRRWVQVGHLRPIRVGAAIFFDPRQIEALIAETLRR